MKSDAIIKKILDDARLEAERIAYEADEKVAEIKRNAEAEAQKRAEDFTARTEEKCVKLREKMLLEARLERRKDRLVVKRQVMDAAFSKALEMLESMPENLMKSFFTDAIARSARGGEAVIVSPATSALLTRDALDKINDALTSAGADGKITVSGETRTQIDGFILEKDGAETHLTFTALLRGERPSMESRVAEILFGDGR